jgi:DNA sulfur modification protein DndD
MDQLVFDGVGPFRNREVFDFDGDGVTYVYAPNGHGKTSTIDLVRWLIQGPSALENNALRSLKQDDEKDIINHQCFRNLSGGSVTATLNVEDVGRYEVHREIPFGTSAESELTVKEETEDGWEPVDEPEEFLSSLLPQERLGFNLLTGEHVQEFVEELSGPIVKESVEKLLRNPELVRVHEAVSGTVEELEKQADKAARAERRYTKLKDQRAELKEKLEAVESTVRELEDEESTLQSEVEELNQKLAQLDEADELEDEREAIEDTLETLERRKQRETDAIQNILTPAWKPLLKAGAHEDVETLLDNHEAATQRLEEWQRAQGKAEHLRSLLETNQCECGHELGEDRRVELEQRIDKLEAAKPEVPELPADEWTLRSWTDDAPAQGLADQFRTHKTRLAEIEDDSQQRRDRLAEIDAMLAETDAEEADNIKARIKRRKMKVNSVRDDLSKHESRRIDVQKELNDVKRKLRDTDAEDVDGPLMRRARDYQAAFREAIDRALPELQDALEDRTQEIFSKLFQKESDYQVELSESSMVPRVVKVIDDGDEPEPVPLSQGEQTRLGLALLFALREVAHERPFLLLDAPFSTLDDEGTHRLLELIADHDGQVVVFTKNAFPEGRWYEAIEAADPSVFRMDWVMAGPDDREGHTEISETDVGDLRLQEVTR